MVGESGQRVHNSLHWSPDEGVPQAAGARGEGSPRLRPLGKMAEKHAP